ncbi:MAG: hypothetical protein J6A44_04205 [Paludibacteraceae bacterium]|nr:hypothetical protein [Paludibacteraceae bacterium]
MKKLFLLLSLMATISISAQTNKHSFGILIGSYNGLSYKTLVSENFAIQADLGVGFLSAPGSYFIGPGFIQASEDSWNFYANPNFSYQKTIYTADWGNMNAFIGGGVSLGIHQSLKGSGFAGKTGANVLMGVEFASNSVPLDFGLDFRPGYGMTFFYDIIIGHFFDWALAASIRYRF